MKRSVAGVIERENGVTILSVGSESLHCVSRSCCTSDPFAVLVNVVTRRSGIYCLGIPAKIDLAGRNNVSDKTFWN